MRVARLSPEHFLLAFKHDCEFFSERHAQLLQVYRAVSSGNASASISFSRNVASYRSSPKFRSQIADVHTAALRLLWLWVDSPLARQCKSDGNPVWEWSAISRNKQRGWLAAPVLNSLRCSVIGPRDRHGQARVRQGRRISRRTAAPARALELLAT